MTGIPRWLPSVVLVAALAVAVTQVSVARTMVLGWIAGELLHPPSDRDQFFFLVAVDFKQPDLCDRIDGRADGSTGGGWETGDFHLRRLRSECSSRVSRRDWAPSEVPRSMPAFATQMRAVGYTDADLAEWVYNAHHDSTLVNDLYRDLLADDEFRSRLRAAASYAEPRDPARLRSATPLEIVYQMVAFDAPEAVLCSKISPNATVKGIAGAQLLESRCRAHVAFTTRDSSVCESLPAARPSPYVDVTYDSREECQTIIAMYRQRDAKEIPTEAPARVSRAADLRHVLHDIRYPIEKLPHVPAPTDDDYWEFVSDLSFRGAPDARAEFLRRVAALDAR
jgi:hypothetical protein